MAAGKTTLARALARRLDWRADDLDEMIEARERRTVAEIFAAEGEPYFRAIEREALAGLLAVRHAVVATGGGTFVDAANRSLMLRDGACIWLDVPLDRIVERIPPDGRRPLAADRLQLNELYARRTAAYQQAHFRLDGSRAPVEELVERVLEWVGY